MARNFSPFESRPNVVRMLWIMPVNDVDSLITVSIKPVGQCVAMHVRKLAKSLRNFLSVWALAWVNPWFGSSSAAIHVSLSPPGKNLTQSGTCLQEAIKVYSQMETSSLFMAPSVGLSLKGFDFGAVIVDLVDSPCCQASLFGSREGWSAFLGSRLLKSKVLRCFDQRYPCCLEKISQHCQHVKLYYGRAQRP